MNIRNNSKITDFFKAKNDLRSTQQLTTKRFEYHMKNAHNISIKENQFKCPTVNFVHQKFTF
jgi:hypothetical protein